ncbi:hypothetical protein B566_EDAN008098 [Ephemera danica]|nr:hypothetical protein B566_EDAN008098 [Ephemera danica]
MFYVTNLKDEQNNSSGWGSGTPGTGRRLLRAPLDPTLRKRPVSLLVAVPQEELSFPDYITPPASPRRLASLRKSVMIGNNTMTPTSSLEKLKDRIMKSVSRNKIDGEEIDDQISDESTPLVSELSTPTLIIPPVTMTLASPPQPSSSDTSVSSSVSLTQTLETPGELMSNLNSDGGGGGGQAIPQCLPETQV